MAVTVIVGGQYGSEGKGKIAHWLAGEQQAEMAIRVGGPNSGHTVEVNGRPIALRQVPTPCLHNGVIGLLPAGSYINPEVLLAEIEALGMTPGQLIIHPDAVVIDEKARHLEHEYALVAKVGSTGQGVGGAIARRALRAEDVRFAKECPKLIEFVSEDAIRLPREFIKAQRRIVLEGTQGFGLSLLHSGRYPFVTSRDTTAAAVLSEAGVSPIAVDCIALVLRAFPIRVNGNSGYLENEITWKEVESCSGAGISLTERTTVTGRVRRVARFDAALVREAIAHNLPTVVALNHVDYFDYSTHGKRSLSRVCAHHVAVIENELDCSIELVGTGPATVIRKPAFGWQAATAA